MATYREDPQFIGHLQGNVTEILARLAHEVAADAQQLVPVDTGLLRSRIEAGEVEHDAHGQSVKVHARTDYAVFVELGTSRTHAQPYLRPALYKRRGL